MDEQISLEQIKRFREIYNSNPQNKIIENAITKNGLENACINRDIIIENQPVFNIELPDSKRYDQKDSLKCWIFAGLNVIKHNIANNLNIDVMDLELSDNYIAFYDKLEKSNNAYENIIKLENIDYKYIKEERIVEYIVTEGGYWDLFVSIVNKYGLIPYSYNPTVIEGIDSQRIERLFTEKVKKDIIELIELKRNNATVELLSETKNRFLEENYMLLSKILGEPLYTFDYEYKDKNGEYKRFENLTPIEFKNKFLSINLQDFVVIGSLPMYNKEYYKMYRKKYLGNRLCNIQFLNLPIDELKELTIKQLKDNTPVFLGANVYKCRDKQSGVLDTRLYNYKESFGLDTLTKEEALNLEDISNHHRMVFTGVNIISNKPQRWKVEDSYGDKSRFHGYYIMNDNYFDEFVLSVVIDKKYLSIEQLELLNQEPIEINIDEPF